MARRQALESPSESRSSAIPQTEIASYPREWHGGTASGNIAISLLTWDSTEASDWSLWVCPYQLSGHSVQSLDPVLKLNLLKNLSLRDYDGQAGFGSRDSSQKMSMVMILLLIV